MYIVAGIEEDIFFVWSLKWHVCENFPLHTPLRDNNKKLILIDTLAFWIGWSLQQVWLYTYKYTKIQLWWSTLEEVHEDCFNKPWIKWASPTIAIDQVVVPRVMGLKCWSYLFEPHPDPLIHHVPERMAIVSWGLSIGKECWHRSHPLYLQLFWGDITTMFSFMKSHGCDCKRMVTFDALLIRSRGWYGVIAKLGSGQDHGYTP